MATNLYTERDFDDAWDAAGSDAPESDEATKRRESLRERLYTVGQLREMEPPESEQLLGPLLVRRGRTLIAGHTGEGKTTLAMWMVSCAARGEEFLGWKGAGDLRVMVIDVEQGIRDVKRVIDEVDLPDETLYWSIPEGLALESDRLELEEAEAAIADKRPDIILADPLYKLHRGDPNDQRLAAEVMRVLDGWRTEYGFNLLIPMHPRKPPNTGGTFTKHDIAGSGTWIWGAEVILGLQRQGGNASMLHFWKDRYGELPVNDKWLLTFDREHGFRREANDSKLTAKDHVCRLMAEMAPEWLSRRRIASSLNISPATVKRVMEELEDATSKGQFALRKRAGKDGAYMYTVDVAPDADRYAALLEDDDDF